MGLTSILDIFNFFENISLGSIIAVVIFVVYWIEAFFIIYHLIRFGVGPRPKIFAMIFFIGSAVLFMAFISAYNQFSSNFSFNFGFDSIPNFIRLP